MKLAALNKLCGQFAAHQRPERLWGSYEGAADELRNKEPSSSGMTLCAAGRLLATPPPTAAEIRPA